MGLGDNILFSSTKVILDVGILYLIHSQKYTISFTCQAGNESCWVSSIYLKGMVAYEKGTFMTVLRKALQTCSGKVTLVCSSVLDRNTSTFYIHFPHPHPATSRDTSTFLSYSLKSYTVLMPCLLVKVEEAFMFIP